ncbi:MAG: hypothetical protein Q9M89_05515 [Persephonella sp.]|nr:hypothetical protein [Persephonella sp.]
MLRKVFVVVSLLFIVGVDLYLVYALIFNKNQSSVKKEVITIDEKKEIPENVQKKVIKPKKSPEKKQIKKEKTEKKRGQNVESKKKREGGDRPVNREDSGRSKDGVSLQGKKEE